MISRIQKRVGKLDGHMREILSKGAVAFGLKIVGAGLAFAFHIAIARILGATGAGIYFLALTIVTVVATASRLGMDNAVIRFVAANAAEAAWGKVAGVFRHAMHIALGVALIASGVLFLLADWLASSIFSKPELAVPLRLMALVVAPLALMTLHANALQGLRRVRDSLLMLSVWVPLLASAGLLILGPKFGVGGAIAAYGIGVVLSLVFGRIMWLRAQSGWGQTVAEFPMRTLLVSSFPLLGAIALQQLTQALPTLMLGIWGSSVDVGLFSAAQRTAALVGLVLIAANSIVAPKFAALYHKGDMASLDKVTRHSALLMTAMAAPVLLVFLVIPQWIMGLFGSEFSAGWLLLAIMALGQLINVATGSVGLLLMMTGNEGSYLSASLLAVGINAVLSVGLIPMYGALGAAVAAAVSLAAVNLLRVHHVWRTMGVMTLPLLRFNRE